MVDSFDDDVEAVRGDRVSSASQILERCLARVLELAVTAPVEARALAARFATAQPTMAGLRNLARVAGASDPAALPRFADQVRRAVDRIVRTAIPTLRLRAPERRDRPLHVVTCSRSAVVEAILLELGKHDALRVSCAESRPGLEGRRLAVRLAAAGVTCDLYTDGAISTAIPDADVLLVGADALSAAVFVNKAGTAALAAWARARGVASYVACGREKLVTAEALAGMPRVFGPPAEVWAATPVGVGVANPYFEEIPLELVTGVFTDGGLKNSETI